jgi:hypothetical protein
VDGGKLPSSGTYPQILEVAGQALKVSHVKEQMEVGLEQIIFECHHRCSVELFILRRIVGGTSTSPDTER